MEEGAAEVFVVEGNEVLVGVPQADQALADELLVQVAAAGDVARGDAVVDLGLVGLEQFQHRPHDVHQRLAFEDPHAGMDKGAELDEVLVLADGVGRDVQGHIAGAPGEEDSGIAGRVEVVVEDERRIGGEQDVVEAVLQEVEGLVLAHLGIAEGIDEFLVAIIEGAGQVFLLLRVDHQFQLAVAARQLQRMLGIAGNDLLAQVLDHLAHVLAVEMGDEHLALGDVDGRLDVDAVARVAVHRGGEALLAQRLAVGDLQVLEQRRGREVDERDQLGVVAGVEERAQHPGAQRVAAGVDLHAGHLERFFPRDLLLPEITGVRFLDGQGHLHLADLDVPLLDVAVHHLHARLHVGLADQVGAGGLDHRPDVVVAEGHQRNALAVVGVDDGGRGGRLERFRDGECHGGPPVSSTGRATAPEAV